MNNVVMRDASTGEWLQFERPLEVLVAHELQDVLPALNEVERSVNEKQLWAAGFISYEAAPAFDKALSVRAAGRSFPLVWFGLFKHEAGARSDSSDSIFWSPKSGRPFPRSETPRRRSPISSPSIQLQWSPPLDQDAYTENIRRIKSYIEAGDTYQVNYSFPLRAPFEGTAYELFLELWRAQPSSYNACIETDDFAICSASPELFFSLDGDNIVTRPMKGTAPRGLTLKTDKANAESLRMSEKNRAENLMIVDMIRNDLGRIAEVGSVRVQSLFNIERYPTVWQMTSTVAARTNSSIVEIMTALFPCASVTGAPKSRTMEIIAELELTPRKIYTGAIGFIAPNRKAQFNVAIRTVLIDKKKNEAEYGVGGGVVWASTAEGEYEECLTKASVLTEHRPNIALFETILFTREDGFFLLDKHLARLKDSAEYFAHEFNEESVRRMLTKVQQRFSGEAYSVRLKLDNSGSPSVETQLLDAAILSLPARVRFAATPVDSKNLFLYHKTTHRKMYDDALASVSDCDDVILCNDRGEITESTIANVVVEIHGELFTPPVGCGLLAGTFRRKLLEEGRIKERIISVEEFKRSSRIFLVNSVRKWREVQLLHE